MDYKHNPFLYIVPILKLAANEKTKQEKKAPFIKHLSGFEFIHKHQSSCVETILCLQMEQISQSCLHQCTGVGCLISSSFVCGCKSSNIDISEGSECANPVFKASLKPLYSSRVLKRLISSFYQLYL